jgi:hypothetical protein
VGKIVSSAILKSGRTILLLALIMFAFACLSDEALAITESEVQAQVDANGRETVAGNVFIWFLCAIAFLKISQKIDGFLSGLGLHVGNTGGSMLAEALIATRGIAMARAAAGGFSAFGGFRGRTGNGGARGAGGTTGETGFMSGGLAGVASRHFAQSAAKSATDRSGGGPAGSAFASSMEKGGDFANGVIAAVAKGNISTVGSMKGEQASKALMSYMGQAGQADAPKYTNVEIGGGRIMGTENTSEHPDGIEFGMYDAEQYMTPDGEYNIVESADDVKWYKQYAADAVKKTPYNAPDGSVAYNETIVKKLPPIPRRKDRT